MKRAENFETGPLLLLEEFGGWYLFIKSLKTLRAAELVGSVLRVFKLISVRKISLGYRGHQRAGNYSTVLHLLKLGFVAQE